MRFHRQAPHAADRIADDFLNGQFLVDDAIDEGGIGAVLQQAAHEIGEQILVAADGGIHAARVAAGIGRDDMIVKRLAHAMQALKLEIAAIAREFENGAHRMGVVGGELGIERLLLRQQTFRAGDIRDIRRGLAGEDRVAFEPALLALLDLAIPIGALDEAHHEAPAVAFGHVGEPRDQRQCPLLITLYGKAESIPAGERGIGRDRLDDVEGEIEALGLLRIHGEADILFLGEARERGQARHQLLHDALALGEFVTRVEGRELDGDTRPLDRPAPRRGAADSGDGCTIGAVIAFGVIGRACGFAQHVVGIAITALFRRSGALEPFFDVAAHHELPTQDSHGLRHRLADHRLAAARHQAAEHTGEIAALLIERDDAARQHEGPGRGIDE